MTRSLLALFLLLALAGCGGLSVSEHLSAALLEQDDPETVAAGAPAFLLLSDGLIHNDPDDEDLLMAGANLYGAYAGVFVTDGERAQRLTARARAYAERAMCEYRQALCNLAALPFERFQKRLALVRKRHVPMLYSYAAAWAGWIQARSSDWNAIAELPRVKAAMHRVVEVDETYANGGAHLYLGIMASLIPPAAGGKPEEGRAHFERALTLSQGKDLMVKVEYARRYARLTFDRVLHDRLLNEVLAAPVNAPGLTLSNTLAQRAARELLKSADSFF
jgi:hypothetical protein